MDELPSLVRLGLAGLDPLLCTRLLTSFGSAVELFQADSAELQRRGVSSAACRRLRTDFQSSIDCTFKWAEEEQNHLLSLLDAHYPPLLLELPDPPPLLYVQGDLSTLLRPQIAIVGSRKATPAALSIATSFACELAQSGLCITSGLAAGIDTAAHRGCLEAGRDSIAVVGNGLNQYYPLRNRQLQQQIAQQGAVVSEFSPDMAPLARNFPRRNRIISGLSLGTLVIEAARKSGSLITARLAMEQNREVFAVPGSINNPQAQGCHSLIQQGAKLTQRSTDVLEELELDSSHASAAEKLHLCADVARDDVLQKNPDQALSAHQSRLLASLGYDPVTVDTLAQSSRLPASEIMAGLLQLELNGVIKPLSGGRYVRC